jgi:hypothetical protein
MEFSDLTVLNFLCLPFSSIFQRTLTCSEQLWKVEVAFDQIQTFFCVFMEEIEIQFTKCKFVGRKTKPI